MVYVNNKRELYYIIQLSLIVKLQFNITVQIIFVEVTLKYLVY